MSAGRGRLFENVAFRFCQSPWQDASKVSASVSGLQDGEAVQPTGLELNSSTHGWRRLVSGTPESDSNGSTCLVWGSPTGTKRPRLIHTCMCVFACVCVLVCVSAVQDSHWLVKKAPELLASAGLGQMSARLTLRLLTRLGRRRRGAGPRARRSSPAGPARRSGAAAVIGPIESGRWVVASRSDGWAIWTARRLKAGWSESRPVSEAVGRRGLRAAEITVCQATETLGVTDSLTHSISQSVNQSISQSVNHKLNCRLDETPIGWLAVRLSTGLCIMTHTNTQHTHIHTHTHQPVNLSPTCSPLHVGRHRHVGMPGRPGAPDSRSVWPD
ncbi:unnamed protein product [Protopolystoma xenopodis]|uniref:Uncharacterized protein n=1 Tax=Protopolystoma xenopodis TaxID=117903 RepID=A0A3S5B2S0_9PLAT|nr:unnamed protein product [Protopolystoma xenopodis]